MTPRTTRLLFFAASAVILLSAILIRALGIDSNPPGLWQDEASTGYDAYLLWTTARDRAGKLLPVIAQSFGDFPLAGYRYLTAPFVGLFGMTPATERIVASITGSAMVAASGFFALQAFGRAAAIGTMLSAAFTPMWIVFSRYGSEAILLPFCLIFGAALVELGRKENYRRALWAAAVVLAFAAYTYHAVKVILPLWMIGFLIYHLPLIRELWQKERKHLIGPAIVFTALVLPSVIMALTKEGMARGNVVMVWVHHKGWNMFPAVLRQYLGYWEPNMLFLRGGPHLSQSFPGIGIWNLIDLPLMVLGFIAMAKGGHRAFGFLFFWLLLGPLPGAATYETGNIGRAIAWLPAPQLIAGLGFAFLVERPANKILKTVLAGAAVALFVVTGLVHYKTVLIEYPKRASREFQYEITHSLRCAREHRKNNEKIVVQPQLLGNEVSEVFIGFYLGDILDAKAKGKDWELAGRGTVNPGEIYVMKPGNPPQGKKLCDVKAHDGSVVAMVFGANQ